MIARLLILGMLFLAGPKPSVANDCEPPFSGVATQTPSNETSFLSHQFDSGASWSLCWHIDDHTGLVLSKISYAAPNTEPRRVLDALSLGQILFRYDEDLNPAHLLADPGLGGAQHGDASGHDCLDGTTLVDAHDFYICQQLRQINHLTDARRLKPILRHELSLHAYSRVGTHQFEQIFRFSEDGEIAPSMVHSGQVSRFTDDPKFGIPLANSELLAATASVLVNWRMDFNIDGSALNDRIDEFEFLPSTDDNGARHMAISRLDTETSRPINNLTFRGWRISDDSLSSGANSASTRIGYYLDPQTAGFAYVSQKAQWPNADFAVTAKHDCERLASFNTVRNPDCHDDLDAYLDGESLEGTDIVTWYSVSHQFTPQAEDFPAVLAREIGFKLIPFDWTAQSTFVPEPEDATLVSGSSE